MKIAIITTKSEKTTPLQSMNHLKRRRLLKQKLRSQLQFSPLDGAQIRKNINSSKTTNLTKITRTTITQEK
jgi:hypothetical protein